MQTNTATRVLLLILGILLVILGFVLFATPGMNTVLLGYIACILMIVYGITQIVFYVTHHKDHSASGWTLAGGILTTLLGVMLLFLPGAQILTMTIVFAVWVLMTGIMCFAGAFSARDAGSHSWGWTLAAGIVGILLGIWLMFDPMLSLMSIGFLLPIAFIFEGVSAIVTFFSTRGEGKEVQAS